MTRAPSAETEKRLPWRRPASLAAASLALLLTGACAGASTDRSPALDAPSVEAGRAFAQARCAACHAVEAGQASPRAGAPTFVELNQRYVATTLQKKLADMVETEHSEMPPLRVHWDEIEALMAYMQTLATP